MRRLILLFLCCFCLCCAAPKPIMLSTPPTQSAYERAERMSVALFDVM